MFGKIHIGQGDVMDVVDEHVQRHVYHNFDNASVIETSRAQGGEVGIANAAMLAGREPMVEEMKMELIQTGNLGLRIFSFCIRERRVLGLRSRIAAAPGSPSITQPVRSSTWRM